LRPSDHLVRSVIAIAGTERGVSPVQTVKRLWPDDQVAKTIVERAATVPADTTVSGWAAELAGTAFLEFVATLGPASALSGLLPRALHVPLSRRFLTVPALVPAASSAGFVRQGTPIPTQQPTTDVAVLELKKVGAILPLTREVITSSAAEAITRAVMTEAFSFELDSALLDTNAGTTTRPGGLRSGVNATAAAGAGTDAMKNDLAALADMVCDVGGLNIGYIADPKSAVKLKFAVGPQFDFPILASNALAAGTLVCIALPALCIGFNPQPLIEASPNATVQMDTAPQAGGLIDGSSTAATNVRSGWQTDSIFVRFLAEAAWCLRASNAIAWTESVNW
jgi:hypothetical protein